MTRLRATGLLLIVVACGGTPPVEAPKALVSSPPASSCEHVRERLDHLERVGRVERLFGATASVAPDCPALGHHVRALHASAASALGACEDAKAAAQEVEHAADANAADRARAGAATRSCSAPGDGESALAEALVAKEKGDGAAARRLFNRAARALEKTSARPLSLETTTSPNNAMYPRAMFSGDGRWAVGAVGHRLTIIDAPARRRALSFGCEDSPTAAFGEGFVAVLGCEGAPGEDARAVITDGRQRLLVFSLPSARRLDFGAVARPDAIAAARSLLAAARDGEVALYDVAKGTTSWKVPLPVLPGARGVAAMAFDPRASRLAVRDRSGALIILSTADGRVARTLVGRRDADDGPPVFSPDGELVVDVGTGAPATLWTVATGSTRSLPGRAKASAVTFSHDGRQAVFWRDNHLSTLDVASGKWLSERALPENTEVSSVVESKGRWFSLEQTGGDANRVDLASGARHPVRRHTTEENGRSVGAALSPDASHWAFVVSDEYFEGNPVHIGSTSETEVTYPSHVEVGKPRVSAMSDDATLIAMSGRGSVILMELPSGRIARRWPAMEPASLVFSPRRDALAVATDAGVEVNETRDGRPRFRIPDVYRPAVAWSPDVLAVAERAGPVHIFDAMTGRSVRSIPMPASQDVTALAFESDGTLLAATYGGALAMRLDEQSAAWSPREMNDGLQLGRCPTESAKLPAWMRRDLRHVVSVSADCRIALVHDDNGVLLRRLPQGDPVVMLEPVYGGDELFFRSGTTVRDIESDGADGRWLILTDDTRVRGRLGDGDVFPRSRVQLVGPRARDLVTCRMGARVLPTEMCDERFVDPELLDRFLADAR